MLRPRPFRTTILIALAAWTGCLSSLSQTTDKNSQAMQFVLKGRDATQRGDLTTAGVMFQRAVDAAPTLPDGYLGLGLVDLRRGRPDDAVSALTHAAELAPNLAGAHLFLGIAEYQMGQGAKAAAALQAEVTLQPANVEALKWLGIVELGNGQPEAAITPLDRAAALDPKSPDILYYHARAHSLVAENGYKDLYLLDPDSALVHRALAENFDGSGQPEKAIGEYELAIKKDPTNADLQEALAEANQKMGRIDAAKAAYEAELKLNPHSAIALYNIGRIDVERGKPESGVAALRLAEAAHASPAPTDFYLGLGLAELGQNAEAAQWLEKSLTHAPSLFVQQGAWYQLARVYPKLGRKEDAQHALLQLKEILAQLQAQKEVTAKQAAAQSTPVPDAPSVPKQP